MIEALACAQPVGQTPEVQTRVLVISDLPGRAEMVARNVGRGDPGLAVRSERMTLADLWGRGALTDTDLVIFGIRPGLDADVAALQQLKADGHQAVKSLGLTTEPLSLAVARGLMEAGLDEVMPLAAAAPRLTDATRMEPVAQTAQVRRGDTTRDGLIVAVAAAPRIAVVDLDFQNGVLGPASILPMVVDTLRCCRPGSTRITRCCSGRWCRIAWGSTSWRLRMRWRRWMR